VRRDNAKCDEGDVTEARCRRNKEGCGDQRMEKKKRIDKKTNELAGASRLAFMSGKLQHTQTQEKMRPPSVYE
jgi:hypothetical protein